MTRLTGASGPGGVSANFYYDGLNPQVARVVSWRATRTISVYDGWNLYAEYGAVTDPLLEQLVYGAGGDLVDSPLLDYYYYPDAFGRAPPTWRA